MLSLEIKPNPFNTHCSLKLSFTCQIRRVNAMFFLGRIDDITTSFTPRWMQVLPMLIIPPLAFQYLFYLLLDYLYYQNRYAAKKYQGDLRGELVGYNDLIS